MKTYHHQTIIDDTTYIWPIDIQAAGKVMTWIERKPAVFEKDLAGMATYFPYWLLVGGNKNKALHCKRCATFCVPTDGAVRCLKCRRKRKASQLLWLGHIPVLARPEDAFIKRQQALQNLGFAEVTTGERTYLLVPLAAYYPNEWPNVEPIIRYAPAWLKGLGLSLNSSRHHLIRNGQACIFSWGQWYSMGIHEVLQQRMVNHIASLFKIAAGQQPAQAFIGRIHNNTWHPEELQGSRGAGVQGGDKQGSGGAEVQGGIVGRV